MKVIFLGTHSAEPVANGNSSCCVVDVGESLYLIDAGAPIIQGLLSVEKEIKNLKAIFITHTHMDHIANLPAFLDLTNWCTKEVECTCFLPEQNIIDWLKTGISLTESCALDEKRIKLTHYKSDFVYNDGKVKVSFFINGHLKWANRPSYSILFESENKKIFFSGDLSLHLHRNDFPTYVLENQTDMFVLEYSHIDIQDIQKFLPKIKTKCLVLNHIKERDYDQITQIKNKYSYQIILSQDGQIIEV